MSASKLSCSNSELTPIGKYPIGNKIQLIIARGSVLDFASSTGAIVNAANEGCTGGGGVDGAISSAGGDNLLQDRLNLPALEGGIRCPTGSAKLTGPNSYGSLKVPYVVHAVGPNYLFFDDYSEADELLRSAYQSTLNCCCESKNNDTKIGDDEKKDLKKKENPEISDVAFSLLSAGVFRGNQSLKEVLTTAVKSIRDWSYEQDACTHSLTNIYMCAFTQAEANTLVEICEEELNHQSKDGEL